MPSPSTQEPPRTDPPNNRKETTITISESGHDPGQSLLSVSIVFNNNSVRRNSAPNRMLQIEPNHSQLERRHSAEKTYEEQKREKRKKNDMKKKKNKKKSNRIHPIAAFVEKTKEADKDDIPDEDTPVPGPSAEDEETLQKIQELENKVDSNLDDLLGSNRQDMIIDDQETNDENDHKGDTEIKTDTPDKNDKPNEDDNTDNPIPGPSGENEENKEENNQKSENTEINKGLITKIHMKKIGASAKFPSLKSEELFCQVGCIVSLLADMYMIMHPCG